jgi:hypothetical protein
MKYKAANFINHKNCIILQRKLERTYYQYEMTIIIKKRYNKISTRRKMNLQRSLNKGRILFCGTVKPRSLIPECIVFPEPLFNFCCP